MACTLHCRVVLNPAFRYPLFTSHRYRAVRMEYLGLLKNCVAQLFSKAYYPLNVEVDEKSITEFTVLAGAMSQRVTLLVGIRLNIPPHIREVDAGAIELDAFNHSMRPDFLKYVKLIGADI